MLFSFRHSNFIPLVPIVICFGVWVQVLFLFRHSTWRKPVVGQAILSCGLRFAVKCLYELCPQAFYARRNRRNSPSMARFLLASASMPRHFCASQHNSTDTKQLRYSPSRQYRLPHHLLPPLTSSPCEASTMYSSPFVIWPPGCAQALLPPAFVSYPAYI